MIRVDEVKCKGCKVCEKTCPTNAVTIENKLAVINENCVGCNACVRVCPFDAMTKVADEREGVLVCTSCPIGCSIPPTKIGACGRYENRDGNLVRNRNLVIDPDSDNNEGGTAKGKFKPLITAVGSGSTYPCFKPAPFIIQEKIDGCDVVTSVTEAPLSYSGAKVKIDTNMYIGEEGAKVKRDGKVVGMVTTEEYGSKMLTIGGVNLLSGSNDGFLVAKTVVDLTNGKQVKLKVENGSTLEIQQGEIPVIDGKTDTLMRVGCGSATIGLFGKTLGDVVDEAIILDAHVIGLLTEHAAGRELGLKYSGVIPRGRKSTNGRYFGEHGDGIGGTDIHEPKEAVAELDMNYARPGMKVLVTETTGQTAALLEVTAQGTVEDIPMTNEVAQAVKAIEDTCEKSNVSIIYTGGTGGSARGGVTTIPKKLTEAIHNGEVTLTIGGAPTFVLPGGGINFMADASKMASDPITWVPTPATVAPVEYTMTRDTFEKLGGHTHHIKTKKELLKELDESEA
ncbi:4Fe-4S binding protein [Natranaerobius thermophilus]|uniref:4Fe-4S ferredoxin iron-sulfur binding domain protein n=1 Tax=Natranaerobius thermophilus (strain ATCC BAA-1301 / DSM 18059 / JW/NM-WN-LF) TaxID=457570 RepID=B2A7K5_NATTJ|nr:4Fe-4S binding protein [Natranaerobius thermophilus]ACB85714.1 4Fe-4S ferredoxin iron-sulfur binding domain protein [Natranaerobius thermophilus JW/NM-WN-LF]